MSRAVIYLKFIEYLRIRWNYSGIINSKTISFCSIIEGLFRYVYNRQSEALVRRVVRYGGVGEHTYIQHDIQWLSHYTRLAIFKEFFMYQLPTTSINLTDISTRVPYHLKTWDCI